MSKLTNRIEIWINNLPLLKTHPKLLRLGKFILSAFIIYFICKAPVIWLLTDIAGVHYVLSGAIAGATITLLNFIPSEFWIWKKKSEELR